MLIFSPFTIKNINKTKTFHAQDSASINYLNSDDSAHYSAFRAAHIPINNVASTQQSIFLSNARCHNFTTYYILIRLGHFHAFIVVHEGPQVSPHMHGSRIRLFWSPTIVLMSTTKNSGRSCANINFSGKQNNQRISHTT